MREIRLLDPVYGAEIYLLIGGTTEEVAERTGDKTFQNSYKGYCFHDMEEPYRPFYVWVESPQLPLLCHELFHLTVTVLGDKGLSLTDESEEAYTYWFENIMEQVERLRILG